MSVGGWCCLTSRTQTHGHTHSGTNTSTMHSRSLLPYRPLTFLYCACVCAQPDALQALRHLAGMSL